MGLFDFFKKKTPAMGSRELFAAEISARVARMPGVKAVTPIAGEFGLEIAFDGLQAQMHLENMFVETRDVSPEDREKRIERQLVGLARAAAGPPSLEAARGAFIPVLRAAFGIETPSYAGRELLPCVNLHLVIDEDGSMRFVTVADLERWNLDFEEAIALGRHNLKQKTRAEARLYDKALGIWDVEHEDDFDSSRLLIPGFLEGFTGRVDGRPIAIVPSRDQLFIAGDAKPEAVVRLCEMAEREYAASPRSISSALYVTEPDGTVVPYTRTQADEARAAVSRAHARFVNTEYEQQKAELVAHLEKKQLPIYVTSFLLVESASQTFTVAPWSPDVDALLPVADLVGVTEHDGAKPYLVRWSDFVRLAGESLKVAPGLFPTRHRVVGALSAERMASIRATQVTIVELA